MKGEKKTREANSSGRCGLTTYQHRSLLDLQTWRGFRTRRHAPEISSSLPPRERDFNGMARERLKVGGL